VRYTIKKDEWDKFYYHSEQFEGKQQKITNESTEAELEKVKYVMEQLKNNGFLPTSVYDAAKFYEFRELIHENFFIIWTAINPPMEHLLYALSDVIRPKNILGLGIFTGNPVVWSMGPAIQKSYPSTKLVGVEIDKNHGRLCQDNFNEVAGENFVKIYPEDAFEIIETYENEEVDMLYLDANGIDPETNKSSKRINYSLLKKAYPKLKPGGIAMCHNAYQPSFIKEAADFFKLTENEEYFVKTATIGIDEMGLEFAIKNKNK
jgi:predicted O-methyltransferase YrrM